MGILREPVGPSPRAVEYVERARSLRPLLEACAEEGERERRLVAAFLAADVAREVFGDRRALLAWGPGPGARAVAVDGGYRVTGTWSLASGCRHATWLGGHCPIVDTAGVPRRGRDGAPEARVMLMPADRATLVDVWHVSGLRGTGSDAFLVEDLFVPREFSVARDSPAERRHPGPLYCFPTGSFYASGFAGVALGIAGAMLEAFVALAGEKSPGASRGCSGRARWCRRRWPRPRRRCARRGSTCWPRWPRCGPPWGGWARSTWSSAC